MSNTSDQTTKPNKTTRLIVGEVGVDTETGIVGKGHSYDNGKTFIVDDTIYGRVYHADDHGKIWKGIQDQVAKVVDPAKSAADSAVKAADAAVASAQVTSYAVSAIASATAEAKQGANEAMSRAKSAWDVATGAKEAVTDFDPLLKSAQSDASKALTQIADTASALSDAKTSFGSDVAEAKQLANTAQATADSAVKSASSVADDLTAVANQAKANANGITKVTSDVGLLQTTVADNSGNISTIQETAKQIQQAVSDNAGNITVAKQTANSAVAVASDAKSNATVAIQTASQASITASNASGQAASAVLTANGAMTTASDAKSNATVAIQTASEASLTATNANSDATVAKQTASEAKVQASNAESDFAQISIRAGQIEASVANNSGAIASVQQTANGLTTTVGNVDDRVKKIEDTTNWTTKTGALDMDTLTTTQNIYYRDTNLKNADGEAGWAYIQVVSMGERVTQTVWHDRSSIQHTRTGAINGSNYNWDDWNKVATNAQVVQVKQTVDGIATTINDPKTGLNATYQTAAGNATTISNVKSDVYQLQTTANGLTSRVGNLESKTNTQQTTIDQNKAAIALKADQTTVDTLKGTVSQNTATLKTQADQIQSKVSASDVSGMLTGYATQAYTQSLVTQKADEWNVNLTKLKNDTQTSLTQLAVGVEGVQAQVYNSDGSSKITQLSNLIATKVSQGDYNSQITQLKNDINLRVAKGDVISQINQEAGGDTLIQVSNGNKSLILDAGNTIITGKEWIPVAAIADLTADQIQAGTLKGVKVDFRDSTGTGMIADGSTLTFDVSNTPAGYLSYSGMPVAELPDGSGGNELSIRYGLSTAIIPADNSGAQATFSKAAQKIGYMTGTSQGKRILSGLEVHSNNHHWLCAVNSDATCNRFEVNDRDGLNIAWHDNTHFWISDGKAKLYKDYDDGQTATKLEVHGWAWVNGWVEAAGHSQHSTLSSKTRIEEADPDHMLDLVNSTDLMTFAFKSEVAEGTEVRHIGPIIDDVNDVAQYQMPAEFIAPTKTARDDDNMIGALFGAVQALTKRIKKMEDKLNG
ncbi:gp58-like family protein [Limosilactobacillus fermentum]|uniref:gp58-like family protein n=1 Tax=Limosilactobacillus fermentum TaxID=1613 RepID=UPI003EC03DC7